MRYIGLALIAGRSVHCSSDVAGFDWVVGAIAQWGAADTVDGSLRICQFVGDDVRSLMLLSCC